jgi:putative transposase
MVRDADRDPAGDRDRARNHYEIDPALARRRVELIFDPLDMEHVEVRFQGRSLGLAIPRQIRRHVHPRASAEPGIETEPTPTGID